MSFIYFTNHKKIPSYEYIVIVRQNFFYKKFNTNTEKKNIFEGLNGIFACIHKSRGK